MGYLCKLLTKRVNFITVIIITVVIVVLLILQFVLLVAAAVHDVKNNEFLDWKWKCVDARYAARANQGKGSQATEGCASILAASKDVSKWVKAKNLTKEQMQKEGKKYVNQFELNLSGWFRNSIPRDVDEVQMARMDLHRSYRLRDFFYLYMCIASAVIHIGFVLFLVWITKVAAKNTKEDKESLTYHLLSIITMGTLLLYIASWLTSFVELLRLEVWYHRKFTYENSYEQPFLPCSIDGRESYTEYEAQMDQAYGTCNRWFVKGAAIFLGIFPMVGCGFLFSAYRELHRRMVDGEE